MAALDKQAFLSGDTVPFCEVIYDNNYAEIAPHLSLKERNIVHVIYSNFKTVDETLREFEPNIRAVVADIERLGLIMGTFKVKLNELPRILDVQEKLIGSILNGTPIDVAHMDLDYEALKHATFRGSH